MKQVLAVLVVLLAGLVALVMTRPGTFHVSLKNLKAVVEGKQTAPER